MKDNDITPKSRQKAQVIANENIICTIFLIDGPNLHCMKSVLITKNKHSVGISKFKEQNDKMNRGKCKYSP